jgi:pyruvate/2-oxoglutarate dehydrogenase complex dihydrolipoamide dehydrogenase (E3) component
MGETCVNTGCIPTKTLVASARVAYLARRAAECGVNIDSPVGVDMTRVKARKDDIVEASNSGLTAWVEGMENVTLIRGHARFEGPRSISVDGGTLIAERIFINVGAGARVPDFPGLEEVTYVTNSGMMELDRLPEHLLIVGRSCIGLEFAQIYRRFGARATGIEMQGRLIAREDQLQRV